MSQITPTSSIRFTQKTALTNVGTHRMQQIFRRFFKFFQNIYPQIRNKISISTSSLTNTLCPRFHELPSAEQRLQRKMPRRQLEDRETRRRGHEITSSIFETDAAKGCIDKSIKKNGGTPPSPTQLPNTRSEWLASNPACPWIHLPDLFSSLFVAESKNLNGNAVDWPIYQLYLGFRFTKGHRTLPSSLFLFLVSFFCLLAVPHPRKEDRTDWKANHALLSITLIKT